MRSRLSILALLLGLGSAMPAAAAVPDNRIPSDEAANPALLGGLVDDADVDLLFSYLGDAVRAAGEGRDIPPPPAALAERAESVGEELRRRGTLAGLLLLKALEANTRELMRESPPERELPPPTSPNIRVED